MASSTYDETQIGEVITKYMRVDIYNTKQTYNLILADPPWKQQRGQGKKKSRPNSSGVSLDYPVCSIDEIKEHLLQATSLAPGGELNSVSLDY